MALLHLVPSSFTHSFIFTPLSSAPITNIYCAPTVCQARSLQQGSRGWTWGPWGAWERPQHRGKAHSSVCGGGMSRRGQGSCPFFSLPPSRECHSLCLQWKEKLCCLGNPHRDWSAFKGTLFVSSHMLSKWLVHSPEKVASLLPSLFLMIV